jgi:hypothetical protein
MPMAIIRAIKLARRRVNGDMCKVSCGKANDVQAKVD